LNDPPPGDDAPHPHLVELVGPEALEQVELLLGCDDCLAKEEALDLGVIGINEPCRTFQ
jgi:hypothetical protein